MRHPWRAFMALSFLCEGLFGLTFKLVHKLGHDSGKDAFVLAFNALALLVSIPFLRTSDWRLNRFAFACGAAVGACLGMSALLTVRAAKTLEGIVFYPLLVSGELVLVTLFSWIIFGERLSRAQAAGMALALLSILLIAA